MTITVISWDGNSSLDISGRSKPVQRQIPVADLGALPEQGEDDLLYLDVAGLSDTERTKALKKVAKTLRQGTWGVLDCDGILTDPAALFRMGAGDYLGAAFCGAGIEVKRFREVLTWAERLSSQETPGEEEAALEKREAFPGWGSLKRGKITDFYMLYVAPSDQEHLREKLGEEKFTDFRNRLASWLSQALSPAEALPWMQSDAQTLFLIPDNAALAEKAAEAALRYHLGEALISNEQFLLDISLPLVFALHRGSTPWEEPGATGTVVSEDVNFIYHLGAKKAQSGRLTLSEEAAEAIPGRLSYFFPSAGAFEAHQIKASRRFL